MAFLWPASLRSGPSGGPKTDPHNWVPRWAQLRSAPPGSTHLQTLSQPPKALPPPCGVLKLGPPVHRSRFRTPNEFDASVATGSSAERLLDRFSQVAFGGQKAVPWEAQDKRRAERGASLQGTGSPKQLAHTKHLSQVIKTTNDKHWVTCQPTNIIKYPQIVIKVKVIVPNHFVHGLTQNDPGERARCCHGRIGRLIRKGIVLQVLRAKHCRTITQHLLCR